MVNSQVIITLVDAMTYHFRATLVFEFAYVASHCYWYDYSTLVLLYNRNVTTSCSFSKMPCNLSCITDLRHFPYLRVTSLNGNIFRVTGHSCGEFTSPGEFPAQRPVTRSFGVFFNLRLNERLSKQSWGWWFETLSRPLWRRCNVHRDAYMQLSCSVLS